MITVLFAIIAALLLFTLVIPFTLLGLFNYVLVPTFDIHPIDYLQAMGMMYLVSIGVGVVRVWDMFNTGKLSE